MRQRPGRSKRIEFGSGLRRLMDERGVTPSDVVKAGISKSQVYVALGSKAPPRGARTRRAFSAALDLPWKDILAVVQGGSGSKRLHNLPPGPERTEMLGLSAKEERQLLNERLAKYAIVIEAQASITENWGEVIPQLAMKVVRTDEDLLIIGATSNAEQFLGHTADAFVADCFDTIDNDRLGSLAVRAESGERIRLDTDDGLRHLHIMPRVESNGLVLLCIDADGFTIEE